MGEPLRDFFYHKVLYELSTAVSHFRRVIVILLFVSQFGTVAQAVSLSLSRPKCSEVLQNTQIESYNSRVLDQCSTGTCWMHAAVTMLEAQIFKFNGEHHRVSLEFLFYHLLRDRFAYGIFNTDYNSIQHYQMYNDGNSGLAFTNLLKVHGAVSEEQWGQRGSLIQNAAAIKKELIDIWMTADLQEKAIAQALKKMPVEQVRLKLAQFRYDKLLEIERVLKRYTGELPSVDNDSVIMKAARVFATHRTYIRDKVDPELLTLLARTNNEFIRENYFYLPDIIYSPETANWLPYRSLMTSTKVNFLPQAKVKQHMAKRLKSGERLFVVIDWRGLKHDLDKATHSSTSYRRTERSLHAIVVSQSKLGNEFARIQNSYGTKFGEDGFMDV